MAWNGDDITPRGRRAQALLAVLAEAGRPLTREVVAERIWGPGRLRNLRQEVYNLRQLPGADDWLTVAGDTLGVVAVTDLEALADREARCELLDVSPDTEVLAGLPTGGSPSLELWLDALRGRWAERLTSASLDGPDRVEQLLAISAPYPVDIDVLEGVLEVKPLAVGGWLEAVRTVDGALLPGRVAAVLSRTAPQLQTTLARRLLDHPSVSRPPGARGCRRCPRTGAAAARVGGEGRDLGDARRLRMASLSVESLALQRDPSRSPTVWNDAVDAVLEDGDAHLTGEYAVECAALAAGRATVTAALLRYPHAEPAGPRHALLLELAAHRLDPERDVDALHEQLSARPRVLGVALAWRVLVDRGVPGAQAALSDALRAMGAGLLPAQRTALHTHRTRIDWRVP